MTNPKSLLAAIPLALALVPTVLVNAFALPNHAGPYPNPFKPANLDPTASLLTTTSALRELNDYHNNTLRVESVNEQYLVVEAHSLTHVATITDNSEAERDINKIVRLCDMNLFAETYHHAPARDHDDDHDDDADDGEESPADVTTRCSRHHCMSSQQCKSRQCT
ncbi:Uu.00g013350.m01.CDS01 [Anthostomella pinea]|uniref:Uu.00g013350.m01.CDS01 n=1 Tax=Anthostomella pinea TaxID=933095 RepID=A0AAI8VY44_9PEZI|nr:Uu.00g013350.m01.CDS01 [Anthostomella pinea]